MKKLLVLLFVAFLFTEARSAQFTSSDEDQLSSLIDSFSVAIVKKDKVWMLSHLSDACKMYEPTGNTLNRAGIIMTFAEGVYNITKSEAINKTYKINGSEAEVSADFNVQGVGKVNGNQMDITGSYRFNLKFKKSDIGWQISEIVINQT
ncbi:MAG: hypothetical protein HQ491_10055 [Bacteroidetes bacterium]|uniref:hypothetical protein n=1 Tax=Daejeonella sp. TaxID=2805397 RepID=UPI00404A327F|nr:hypothetical protein [Bacteroidota bacterium]